MMLLAHVNGGALWGVLLLTGALTLGMRSTNRSRPWLLAVAIGGIGFQVLHFAEHLLQAGYWLARPSEPPWLTPWAAAGRDGIASVTDGRAGTGNELLHLAGNGVFLAGLAAALAVTLRSPRARSEAGTTWLRRATWLQAAHVAEHVVLTTTWLSFGEADGASTLFGALEPGTAVAGAARVWIHFALNLAATAFAVYGAWLLRKCIDIQGGIQWTTTRTRAPSTVQR